jgi:hypothetical protein
VLRARCAKMPTAGHSRLFRGWRAPVSILSSASAVHVEEDLDMGEGVDARKSIPTEPRLESDMRTYAVPSVITNVRGELRTVPIGFNKMVMASCRKGKQERRRNVVSRVFGEGTRSSRRNGTRNRHALGPSSTRCGVRAIAATSFAICGSRSRRWLGAWR